MGVGVDEAREDDPAVRSIVSVPASARKARSYARPTRYISPSRIAIASWVSSGSASVWTSAFVSRRSAAPVIPEACERDIKTSGRPG
jgi:hypothetical protein